MKKIVAPISECPRRGGLRTKCPRASNCWVATCGHSKLKKPNPYWRDQHGICRWEHCIENQPHYEDRPIAKSCPIFGHDCPGGARAATACRAQRDRMSKRRRT